QTFHLPIVYLVDCPGFLIGKDAEETGTIKQGVRAMSAIWQSSVPWCAVIIRNVFGVAGAAHRNGSQYCVRYAWPSGRWGSQVLGSTGHSIGMAVGGIMAAAITGTNTWVGLPVAVGALGTALASWPLSRLMARVGRRPGLTLGYGLAVLGAGLGMGGVLAGSF